jgi:hypothetical protein
MLCVLVVQFVLRFFSASCVIGLCTVKLAISYLIIVLLLLLLLLLLLYLIGHAVAQLVEAVRCKLEGPGFDWNFSFT